MDKTTGAVLLVGLAALAAGFAVPVVAAESTAVGGDELTEIIVTARRTEENLQDVPISITVFNQEQLSNRNIVNSQDLATYVPSLSVDTNFGSENSSFALRGFVQDTGTAPSVGVFFADVIAPRAASNGLPGGDGAGPGSFFDLENVQILKGPQGTLFGRNTTGGDILLVPKKPTYELSGYVEGGAGNYDDGEVQALINVPVNESFRVRAGVVHETREGYLHSNSGVGPTDFDDIDYTAARLSAVIDILPNLENYTIGSYSTTKDNGSLNKLIATDPASIPFGAVAAAQMQAQGSGFYNIQQDLADPASRLQQWQVINTTTWKAADNLTVKNIASYAQLRDYYNNAIFATAFVTPGTGLFAPLPAGIPFGFASSRPYPGSATAIERTITEELQFQGSAFNDRLTWQSGGYFETAIPQGIVGSQSPVTASCITSTNFNCTDVIGALFGIPVAAENLTIGETRFRDYAFYAQDTYKIVEQLKVTTGFRWTEDHEEVDSIQKTYHFNAYPNYGLSPGVPSVPLIGPNPKCTDTNATLPNCEVDYTTDSHAPTWLIDFDYTPIQDLLLYGKYWRGYREGTIAPTAPPPLNIIQPEKVDAYEIGEKTSFHGVVSGTLDAAAFYNDFRNQQIQIGYNAPFTSGYGPFAAPANVGKSRIYGLELDSSLKLFPRFRLDVGYTYLNTRIQEVSIPTLTGSSPYVISGTFQVGDPLELSPKNKVTTTGTFTLPIPYALGVLSFGSTFTHTDKQLVNYSDRYVPAFAQYSYIGATNLLDLNLNWQEILHKPVDLSFFVTNVTSEKYYTFIAGLGGAGGPGFETASVGPPLLFGARVRVRYH